MKKILLTGSTGLIGATVDKTLSASYEIVRLGRQSESDIQADLSKPETLKSLDFAGCDAVVHCAGITDEDFKTQPADAFIQSTLGMSALVRNAFENEVETFIYLSTSHIYGVQEGVIDENTPANPLSDYAIAHYAAEQILKRNAQKFKKAIVLRPNAVFGIPLLIEKFDRWSLIPYSFPLEAVYNQKIVLRSTGEQNRNFIATEDIAGYIREIISTQQKGFKVINPLGKETISVYQFAERCVKIYSELTGNKCSVERPLPDGKANEVSFIYKSTQPLFNSDSALSNFITDITQKILSDLRNGVKYH